MSENEPNKPVNENEPGSTEPSPLEADRSASEQPSSAQSGSDESPSDQVPSGQANPDQATPDQSPSDPSPAGDAAAQSGGAGVRPGSAPGKFDGPYRRETKLPQNPRRVRGGVRMKRKEGDPESWAEQRLWRICEQQADGETLKEGLEYARGGQTRRISFENGVAEASIQGRRTRAYTTTVTLPSYTHEQAAAVIQALGNQSRYAAKLLAGEMPPSIEDVFIPIGLHLFPASGDDIEISCTCKEENQPWCKHAVCATALLGEKLAEDPFLVFELRGIPREHLVEGLRDVRAMTTLGPGPQPVYTAHVAGLTDSPADSLEEAVYSFWNAPSKGERPSVPVEPPEVSHPLLRRLGPSPFQESRFPLVGLLATCYELIGRDALEVDEPDEPERLEAGAESSASAEPESPNPEPEAQPDQRAKARPVAQARPRARASAKPLKRDD